MSRRSRKSQTAKVRVPLSPAIWALPVVLIATAVVFSPALNFQFVFDDRYQIAQNPAITSWSYVGQYFRSHVWGYGATMTSYYRPVFLLVLRTGDALVGMDPVGWHALPIMLHLVNVGLVFAVVRKLADDVTGLIAAALFAVHPVQIEAVGALYGSTDAMMAASLLGSFWAYLRWKDVGRWYWLLIAVCLFGVALLTKESEVVFPAVVAAYEAVVNGVRLLPKEGKGRVPQSYRWIPAVAAVVIVAAYFFARRMALGVTVGRNASDVSWLTVMLTAPLSLVTMLRLWLLPYGMSGFYDCPYVTRPDLYFFLPLLVLIGIGVGVWFWAKKTNELLIIFAASWAVLGLIPAMNLRVMQEGDFVHIRFLYVPSIALSLLAAIALRQVFANRRIRAAFALVLVIGSVLSTRAQMGFLHDNEAMYLRGIAVAPDNRVPKNNLADEYIKAGRLDEATALLDDNLRRHPKFWMSNYNRGYIAYRKQNWAEVADYMGRAIANGCEQTDAYVYRGFALLHLGRTQEAEQVVRQAIALNPNAHTYHYVLGLALRQEQRWDEAQMAFEQELVINPNDAGAAAEAAGIKARSSR